MAILRSKKLLGCENKVTLTIVTSPSNATCTLTYNGVAYVTKSLQVKQGSTVSYSVSHSTYGSTSGTTIVDSNKTIVFTGQSVPVTKEVSWTRPNLTSDGTLGGFSFAVTARKLRESSHPAYMAFDNSTSTYAFLYYGYNYLEWYNPTAIKVTNLSINVNRSLASLQLKGSQNDIDWTSLSITPTSVSSGTTTIRVISTAYCKYYALTMSISGNTSAQIKDLGITATYKTTSYEYGWSISGA